MTDPEEEMYPSWVSWCFDSQHRPVCPSLWDERQDCDGGDCPYSHQAENIYISGSCALPIRLLDEDANIQELADYLYTHSNLDQSEPNPEVSRPRTQSEEDEEDVRIVLEEMTTFEEKDKEDFELKSRTFDLKLCPYFLETGNCLRKLECPYAHETHEEGFVEDIKSRWYPRGKDCECCRGYIFKCEKERCQEQGVCATCQEPQVL
jgi:hypothetical protein